MARWPRARLALAAIFLSGAAFAQSPTPHQQFARDIYRELIEIRTVHPDGDNTATDGLRLRVVGIPVYGVAGIAMEVERMHGRDERLAVNAFDQAIDFLDRLVRALASEE